MIGQEIIPTLPFTTPVSYQFLPQPYPFVGINQNLMNSTVTIIPVPIVCWDSQTACRKVDESGMVVGVDGWWPEGGEELPSLAPYTTVICWGIEALSLSAWRIWSVASCTITRQWQYKDTRKEISDNLDLDIFRCTAKHLFPQIIIQRCPWCELRQDPKQLLSIRKGKLENARISAYAVASGRRSCSLRVHQDTMAPTTH